MPRNRKTAHKANHQNQTEARLNSAQAELIPILELVPIGDLKPSPKNPRTHSKKQIEQIKKSVLEFGFTSPALIDENNRLLAGHGRVEAAKLAGLISIPCVRLTHMSEAQKRAYVIADNQLALKAGWDEDFLAEELEALMGLEPGFDQPPDLVRDYPRLARTGTRQHQAGAGDEVHGFELGVVESG